ncbi:MAG: hypothetical protein WC738_00455 [Candidatus Omnitrophota bacterium]|jgi:hypothetical protein
MGIIKKISIGIAFIIVAVISFIIGAISISIISEYLGKQFTHKIRLTEDINLPVDIYEYSKLDFKPMITGKLLKGSIGIQDTIRKGDWVYIKFPVVINAKKFEYIKEKK